jgi:hypothetical protein
MGNSEARKASSEAMRGSGAMTGSSEAMKRGDEECSEAMCGDEST